MSKLLVLFIKALCGHTAKVRCYRGRVRIRIVRDCWCIFSLLIANFTIVLKIQPFFLLKWSKTSFDDFTSEQKLIQSPDWWLTHPTIGFTNPSIFFLCSICSISVGWGRVKYLIICPNHQANGLPWRRFSRGTRKEQDSIVVSALAGTGWYCNSSL